MLARWFEISLPKMTAKGNVNGVLAKLSISQQPSHRKLMKMQGSWNSWEYFRFQNLVNMTQQLRVKKEVSRANLQSIIYLFRRVQDSCSLVWRSHFGIWNLQFAGCESQDSKSTLLDWNHCSRKQSLAAGRECNVTVKYFRKVDGHEY